MSPRPERSFILDFFRRWISVKFWISRQIQNCAARILSSGPKSTDRKKLLASRTAKNLNSPCQLIWASFSLIYLVSLSTLESVSDGVRLSEAELEERRQELLAKAEIDNGEQEDMDEAAARKLFLLFDKRMKKNQDQRIKYAQKPEKYMNVRTIIFHRLLHFFRAKWIFMRTFTK